MLNSTCDELKELIKEAVREVLCEAGAARWNPGQEAMLTLAQIAAIEKKHIVTVRNWARLGKIPGAEKRGGEWRVNRVKYEKDLGYAPGALGSKKES